MDEIRKQIKEIDKKQIKLIAERMQLSKKLGQIKKENGLPVKDDKREKELYEFWRGTAKENGVSPELVEKIWELILEESILTQS